MGLLILISIAAAGLAVLRHAVTYARELFSLSMAVLFISVLMAIFCRGRFRAFNVGFAFFGWGYLALWASPLGSYLPTTMLFDNNYRIVYGSPPLTIDFSDALLIKDAYRSTGIQFGLAAHSLTAFFSALVGGICVRLLASLRGHNIGDSGHPPDGTLLKPGYSREVLYGLWNKSLFRDM